MRDHRTIRTTLIVLALLGGACLVAAPAPAQASWRTWAVHWHHNAVRARTADNRCRAALDLRQLARIPRSHVQQPPQYGRPVDAAAAWGRQCRKLARRYWRESARLLHRMEHPGGYGAARWWPLAAWAGWPSGCRSEWIHVVTGESHGDPNAGGPPHASGLMQILPACRNWRDPLANIRAGLAKYWAALKACGWGWAPWAQTA